MPGTGVGPRGIPNTMPKRTPSVNRIKKRKLHCQICPAGIRFPTHASLQGEGHGLQSDKKEKARVKWRHTSASKEEPTGLRK